MGDSMKLVSFQSMEALKVLINKGYLEVDEQYVDTKKYGHVYEWVNEKMDNVIPNDFGTKYPLWCWVKFKKGTCPPKHKGAPVKGFDVKITFEKNKNEVFITDYRRYAFLLNNIYIPDRKYDKEQFEKELEKHNITTEELKAVVRSDKDTTHRTDKAFMDVCHKIRDSFDKCISEDSDVLQGCVWRINLDEVQNIEILSESNYQFGSFNYLRKNGKRFDWVKDFYDKLD